MIFYDKIENSTPLIKMALKVNLVDEYNKLNASTDIVSGKITKALVRHGFADNNYGITKSDLEQIIKIL